MNKWLFHQNGFTRTILSATVNGVSNFVEENVCVCVFFYIVKGSVPVGQIFPTASLHRDHSISYALVCEKDFSDSELT